MSSDERPRERAAVPPFQAIIESALARLRGEPATDAADQPGAPSPPPPPPGPLPEPPPANALPAERCSWIHAVVNWYLGWRCSEKQNDLKPCKEGSNDCPCVLSTNGTRAVDLVILIDGTLAPQVAALVNAAASQAIHHSQAVCPSELRAQFFTVDSRRPGTASPGTGGFPGTSFTQTHEQYLKTLYPTAQFAHDAPSGGPAPAEQGADAIADVSRLYPWRPGACRAVFYVSDAPLDGGPGQDPADVSAAVNAAVEANTHQVAVFACLLRPPPPQSINPATQADYQNLCDQTGGSLYAGAANQGTFMELLLGAICHACVPRCVPARIPDLRPCISVSWGDSRCDCMETDDTEVLCITVCNCYSNVTFTDLSIGYVGATDTNGNVDYLPDGSPSVQVVPLGPICFGDIPPCRDGRPSCVSREVVLLARGARAGGYQIQMRSICFGAAFGYQTDACFAFDLCQD
jgi:hypothetical protein